MCHKLHEDGFFVIANYRNDDKGKAWQEEQKTLGFDFVIAKGDVTDFEDVKRMVSEINEHYGTISVLVNNAGITRDTPFGK